MSDHNGNGEYDETDGDCFEDMNENGSYDTDGGGEGIGGASDVAFYQASIEMPRLLPIYRFIPVGEETRFTVRTAVRNQPYATQATAPVVCGAIT